ncbi:hypothetical protein EVAR_20978_1 [Eumeta japonica]|uniref:Uncharacterized protein n=1 Tax=Eumeta variegata TaxID=151549 RepID=A0A4C1V6J4_EUMVA|nr:hypothetical protein EVAR_20978_1 [Eumeta japonica]
MATSLVDAQLLRKKIIDHEPVCQEVYARYGSRDATACRWCSRTKTAPSGNLEEPNSLLNAKRLKKRKMVRKKNGTHVCDRFPAAVAAGAEVLRVAGYAVHTTFMLVKLAPVYGLAAGVANEVFRMPRLVQSGHDLP